jgi:glutamate N-acetyltransferase/amino-acid N-acetyltransferase
MTTDTVSKESACCVEDERSGASFTIAGMAKGSGMICPDMATMLAFIFTDVKMEREQLQKALVRAVAYSFNIITVDGDTSTNDMVILLANGASGVEVTEGGRLWEAFNQALLHVCRNLAYKIVADGEGATKVIKLTVKGAPDYPTGRKLARAVLNSSLVKAAFFGEDANWGRIITALGYTEAEFYPELVDIFLGAVQVAASGKGLIFDELQARQVLAQAEIPVVIDLHMGSEEVTAWGCDLSYEYVKINSAYRS